MGERERDWVGLAAPRCICSSLALPPAAANAADCVCLALRAKLGSWKAGKQLTRFHLPNAFGLSCTANLRVRVRAAPTTAAMMSNCGQCDDTARACNGHNKNGNDQSRKTTTAAEQSRNNGGSSSSSNNMDYGHKKCYA